MTPHASSPMRSTPTPMVRYRREVTADAVPHVRPEAQHAVVDALRHGVLIFLGSHEPLLAVVREIPHLNQRGRHVYARQNPQRRFLAGARAHRHLRAAQRLFEDRGEHGRLIHVARLCKVPLDDVDGPRGAAEHREQDCIGLRCSSCVFALPVEPQVKHFRARNSRNRRGVEMKAEKQVGFRVVGRGRAIVEADGKCRRHESE